MRRLLQLILALVIAWLGWLPLAEAAPSSPAAIATHGYDAPAVPATSVGAQVERGPPFSAYGYGYTTYDAVDRGSHGLSPRSGARTTPTIYDYDDTARLVRAARGSHGAAGSSGCSEAGRVVVQRLQVAANTSDRISGPLWSSTKSKTSPQNALRHFNDHRADFPHLNNAAEYVAEAQQFLRRPPSTALPPITRTNGDVVVYDPTRNIFGVMDSTGAPKTYFKPDPAQHGYPTNLDYFNAQNW